MVRETGAVEVEVVVPDSLECREGSSGSHSRIPPRPCLPKASALMKYGPATRIVYEATPYLTALIFPRRLLSGLNFRINTPPEPAPLTYGWTDGDSNLRATIDLVESGRSVAVPDDIEIRMGAPGVDSSFVQFAFEQRTPVDFEVYGVTSGLKISVHIWMRRVCLMGG